jgi:hypothetical protein
LSIDLLKHTEKTHVDYDNLVKAHKIVSSLAVAMDSAQEKQK